MLKKSLIIFIFLMQSFNLSGLYLADVEENDQSEAKALDKEQESFLCISEHLQKASTYCLDCGSWFLNKASNWLSQNTVTGEPALEKECIERKKSGCYKYLQAGTLVLPLVYALISGTATEEIIGHHLPLYLFYFGFDVSEYIADLVLKNKNKEQIKTIIRKGKMAQGALFLSLAPLRFAEAHFINLLTNEVIELFETTGQIEKAKHLEQIKREQDLKWKEVPTHTYQHLLNQLQLQVSRL